MEREGLLVYKLYIICRVASSLGDGARGQLSLLPPGTHIGLDYNEPTLSDRLRGCRANRLTLDPATVYTA